MSKVLGIIAEYNPFHNGHLFHLNESKKLTGSSYTVAIMSGNFAQRGNTSIIDKWSKAKSAIECGVDLVVELPVLYSTSSAENFAEGAIKILDSLKVVDYLSFGAETADINLLNNIATVLNEEPKEYKSLLSEELKKGLSYPKARENALMIYLNDIKKYSNVLSSPNNILGIEYIKAVKRFSSSMEICTIQRKGQGYNDISVPGGENASAAAIRNMLTGDKRGDEAVDRIPACARDIFREAVDNGMIMTPDDFSYLLNYKIYSIMRDDSALLLNYSDVGMQLANKISRLYGKEHFDGSWKELIMKLKSRELTYTRISRALTHILLDIKLDAWNNPPQYARILGFDKAGSDYLKAIRKTCAIPLITKVADESWLLKDDIYAADVYNQTVFEKCGIRIENDFRHGIIRMQ